MRGGHRRVDAGGVDRPVEPGQRPRQPRDRGPRGIGDRHLLEQVGGLLEARTVALGGQGDRQRVGAGRLPER